MRQYRLTVYEPAGSVSLDFEAEERTTTHEADSAEEYWQDFSSNFGPMKTLCDTLDDDHREELHQAFVEFLESGFGSPEMGLEEVADRIAQRIWAYLEERLRHSY